MSVNANRPAGTQPLGSQALGSRGSVPLPSKAPASPTGVLPGDAFKGSGQLEGVRPTGGFSEKLGLDEAKKLVGMVKQIKPEMVATAGMAVAGTVARLTGKDDVAATIEGAQASKEGVDKFNRFWREKGTLRTDLRTYLDAKASGQPFEAKKPAIGDAKPLGTAAKIGVGIDVARGAVSAFNMSKSLVAAAKDPRKLADPEFVKGIGRDALTTLNGVGGVAQLAGKTGFVAKLNPVTGIVAGAAGVMGAATDIAKNGLTWKNGAELASNALNMAGNVAMLMPPAGPVIGAGLKVAALGLDLIRYGVANKDKIVAGGKAAIRVGTEVARTAADFFRDPGATSRKVANAAVKEAGKLVDAASGIVGDGLKKAGSVFGGVKKLFSFGG